MEGAVLDAPVEEQEEKPPEFVHHICCKCGIPFWMTYELDRLRREDRDAFYCPNGHGQQYLPKQAEIDKDQRIKELAAQVASLTQQLAALRKQLDPEFSYEAQLEAPEEPVECPMCPFLGFFRRIGSWIRRS
jgi:hypothetical protein